MARQQVQQQQLPSKTKVTPERAISYPHRKGALRDTSIDPVARWLVSDILTGTVDMVSGAASDDFLCSKSFGFNVTFLLYLYVVD